MEMFKRDYSRLSDIYDRMNYCPLGSGALAGTTYPLDREMTAELLDFYGPTLNSMDSVSDRDYVIELLSALSTIMMHLSRFCEEIILWNSNEYRFIEIDDAYSTGSKMCIRDRLWHNDVAQSDFLLLFSSSHSSFLIFDCIIATPTTMINPIIISRPIAILSPMLIP